MPNKSLTRKDKRTPGANIRKSGWSSKIARLDTSHINIWIFAHPAQQIIAARRLPQGEIALYTEKGDARTKLQEDQI
jgi:hypothetical protein